jgi:hypothetical protein
MAAPKTASWTKFIILLGDGATPTEAFTAVCALTSKSIDFTGDPAETPVLDCEFPDQPAWMERVVRTKSATVAGEGVLQTDFAEEWWDWFDSGVAKNIRVQRNIPTLDGGGHYEGRFILTGYNETGNQDDAKIGVAVEMQSDGAIAWVPAAP